MQRRQDDVDADVDNHVGLDALAGREAPGDHDGDEEGRHQQGPRRCGS